MERPTLETVIETVAIETDTKVEEWNSESTFMTMIDSLEFLTVVFALEERFGVNLAKYQTPSKTISGLYERLCEAYDSNE